MTAILATCIGLAAAVASAPPDATIRITEDCPAGVQALVRRRASPLTVDATGRLFPAGVWIVQSEGVTWRGGTMQASGGERGVGRAGYAFTAELSRDIRLEGATLTNAFRGYVTIRPTGRHEVVGNTFIALGGDGLNFAGDPAVGPLSGLIEGNTFSDIRARRDLGDHPDCIQMWGALDGVTVRGNRILSGTDCQGITTFGGRTDPQYRRIVIANNDVHLDDREPNGIAVGNCADCTIRDNRVRGALAYVRLYDPLERVLNCGNDVERARPAHISPEQWGTLPCPAPPTLTVRVVAPEGVEIVVERVP